MSHVKFISFNATMLNGSLCGRRSKTALIDQHAVATGKKSICGISAGRAVSAKRGWFCRKRKWMLKILSVRDQVPSPVCEAPVLQQTE